jgi:hypothetical protein
LRARSILFLVAAAVSAGITYLVSSILPNELRIRTDIVGYPIHRNFNVDHYFHLYYLTVLVFPLMTMGLYVAGTRFSRRWKTLNPGPRIQPSTTPPSQESPNGAAGIGRLLLVGFALGTEAVVAVQPTKGNALVMLAAITVTYAAGLLLVSRLTSSGSAADELWTRVAAINVWVMPITVIGLIAVSRASGVIVSDGSFRPIPWIPLWLALLLAGLALISIVLLKQGRAWRDVERDVVAFVVAPVLLLVLTARMPDAPGHIDFYHEGEKLTAAWLVMAGWFPWRDVMPIHGLLEDVFNSGLGLRFFENSRWGAEVGNLLVLAPLYWVGVYFWLTTLLRRNRILVAGAMTMVVAGYTFSGSERFDFAFHPRFILLPLVLIGMGAVLRKPTVLRAVAFIGPLAAQVILTPESAFLLPALGLVLFAFEFVHREPERRLLENFRRTILCFAIGIVVSTLWVVFLWVNDAADDFVYYFLTFAPGHRLTGGLPYQGDTISFHIAAVLPVVLIIVSVWYFSFALKRRMLSTDDWVVFGLAFFLFFYYRKFLSRADGHVIHPYAISLFLLVYVVYRLVEAVGRRFRTVRSRAMFSMTLILLLLIPGYAGITKRLETLPQQFRPSVPEPSKVARLGYANAREDEGAILGLQAVLNAMLEPGDGVFDFSNSPAIHYFLNLKPVTRYYHVSMAIRQKTQQDLLNDLRERRPKVVIFDEGGRGLASWDGVPNAVRHYEVSRYLLNEYEPVLDLATNIFYVRKGANPGIDKLSPELLSKSVTDRNELYFHNVPCDWGFAPNFLEHESRRLERTDRVELAPEPSNGNARQTLILTPPPGRNWADYDSIEIKGDLKPGKFDLASVSQPIPGRSITFRVDDEPPESFVVEVGSCPQWHGFGSEQLRLSSTVTQTLQSVTVHK